MHIMITFMHLPKVTAELQSWSFIVFKSHAAQTQTALQESGQSQNFWGNKHLESEGERRGLILVEVELIFTPIYQPDCSSNLRRWPPSTSFVYVPVTSNWSWRGNSLCFMNVTLQRGEAPKKRQNWSHSARVWPELKHRWGNVLKF